MILESQKQDPAAFEGIIYLSKNGTEPRLLKPIVQTQTQ